MCFSSFRSDGFTTMAVINPPEKKLVKRTSVSWFEKCQILSLTIDNYKYFSLFFTAPNKFLWVKGVVWTTKLFFSQFGIIHKRKKHNVIFDIQLQISAFIKLSDDIPKTLMRHHRKYFYIVNNKYILACSKA